MCFQAAGVTGTSIVSFYCRKSVTVASEMRRPSAGSYEDSGLEVSEIGKTSNRPTAEHSTVQAAYPPVADTNEQDE